MEDSSERLSHGVGCHSCLNDDPARKHDARAQRPDVAEAGIANALYGGQVVGRAGDDDPCVARLGQPIRDRDKQACVEATSAVGRKRETVADHRNLNRFAKNSFVERIEQDETVARHMAVAVGRREQPVVAL